MKNNEFEEFTSTDLNECLDYSKEFSDYEPLEAAIDENTNKIERAIEAIQFLIDKARVDGNNYMANKLISIRNNLK
jgi:hypothetical protein